MSCSISPLKLTPSLSLFLLHYTFKHHQLLQTLYITTILHVPLLTKPTPKKESPNKNRRMGIKSLISLHLLPYSCFHLPSSSSTTTTTTTTSPPLIRLISSVDGRVITFHHPIPAGELMAEHPLHLICRSDSFFIGRKVPPLSPSDNLIPGHSYFLLPNHFFHSVLSFLTLSSSLLLMKCSDNNNMVHSKRRLINMFDIRKTDNGVLEVRIKEEEVVMKEEEGVKKGVCTSEGLEKEYKRLVEGCKLRGWKPRLETIRESNDKKSNIRRRLLIRRRKKKEV